MGGVAGGATCAARLRRLDEDAEIVVFDRGPYVSFANCGLPYYVGDVINEEAKLLVGDAAICSSIGSTSRCARAAKLWTSTGRHKPLRCGIWIRGGVHRVLTISLCCRQAPLRYARPGRESICPGIFTLRTVPDSREIRKWIEAKKSAPAPWW